MRKYTAYEKIQAPYLNWSEFLVIPGLPILAVCVLSYFIIYLLGLVPAIFAIAIISLFINYYYHGLKKATPNSSMYVPSKKVPNVIVLLVVAQSFFMIFGVLLTANVGVYLIVLYLKTGVFYPLWFSIWSFVVFGLPVLYYLTIQLKYWYKIYYQAYYFTSLPLSITYDPELLISIEDVTFINRPKKRLSTVSLTSLHIVKQHLDDLSISQKNEVVYEPVFSNLIYIPKQSNVIAIRYYSILEACSYSGEITFPYEQLRFVQNKYPLNRSAILRGMSTDPVILKIQQGGEVFLYDRKTTLTSPIKLKEEVSSEAEHERSIKRYIQTTNDQNVISRLDKIKNSNGVSKRSELSRKKINWELTGDGLEKHDIILKDIYNCFLNDDKLKPNEVKNRYLPLRLEFTYCYHTWLIIHIDPEKLYDVLSPIHLKDPQTEFAFHISICIETGNVSFVIKNDNKELEFDGWQKELVPHRWEDAKNKYFKERENQEKQRLLNAIYELIKERSYLKAQEICKQAIQDKPDFSMLYFYEARLLWYTKGYEACYAQEDYFIDKTKNDAFTLSRIYNHYGCLLDEEHRYEEALPYFEKAAATYPKEVFYTANIAEIHYKLKDATKALHYANKCIDQGYNSPITTEIIKNKGVIPASYYKLKSIDDLLGELSYLAAKFRSAEQDSVQHYEALEAYYANFKQLVALNGGIMALDADAELPDHLMPKEYVDHWLDDDRKDNNK